MTRTRTYVALLPLLLAVLLPQLAYASATNGTIVSGGNAGYAWSNNVGWVNFGATNGNVQVTDSGLAGYAWSTNDGWINLSPTNGGVTNNGEGALGGSAWGASLGWIDFSNVSIDANGQFHGTAVGPGIGTLTFDCTNCSVSTDWRPVSERTPPAPSPGGGGGGGGGTLSGSLAVGSGGAAAQSTATPAIAPAVVPGLPATGNVCAYSSSTESPDINGDGVVDILDFNALMVAWGTTGAQPADINHDCSVDILDFNALMVGWSQ